MNEKGRHRIHITQIKKAGVIKPVSWRKNEKCLFLPVVKEMQIYYSEVTFLGWVILVNNKGNGKKEEIDKRVILKEEWNCSWWQNYIVNKREG